MGRCCWGIQVSGSGGGSCYSQRSIGQGPTRSSGGIEKAEDPGPGDSLRGESGFEQAGCLGATVSIIWVGEQVVQRVGRERSAQKACM